MKVFRILIAILMVVVILIGSVAIIAWRNQDRLIRLVLARVEAQTGYRIVPESSRLAFRSHLVVLLQKPRIFLNDVEVAKVDDVRAVIAFHTIFTSNGLPLYAIALDHPQIRVPSQTAGVTTHGFLKPDVLVAKQIEWALDALSDISSRIEVVDAALNDVDGTPLIDRLSITAYRQHRGPGHWPWMVAFDIAWNHAPFTGAVVTGRLKLGNVPSVSSIAASALAPLRAKSVVPSSNARAATAGNPVIASTPATSSPSALPAPSSTAPNSAREIAPSPGTSSASPQATSSSPAIVLSNAATPSAPTPASNVSPGLEMVSSGRLTFRGFELTPFHGPYGLETDGKVEGSMRYALREDGILFADTVANGKQLTLKGKPFIAAIPLGDLMFHGAYRASMERLEIKKFTLTKNGAVLLTGGGSINQRYEDTRTASIHVEGIRVSLTQLATWLRNLRAMPASLNDLARRFTAGQLELSELVFNPRAAIKDWTARTLREELTIHSFINGANFDPPKHLKLPPVRRAGAAIEYAGGLISLTQGSANLGNSEIIDLKGEIKTDRAPALISYDLESRGKLDVGEIYLAQADTFKAHEPDLAAKITSLSGNSAFDLDASGKFTNFQWSAPDDYALKISPEPIEVAIKGSPSPIAFKSGDVEVRPGAISIDRILAAPTMPQSGNAMLNGIINTDRSPPTFQHFTADLHEFRAETWLPLGLDPHQFAAKGPVGGFLSAQSDAKKGGAPTITGRLTMGAGELQLGFLRAPIVTSSMTIILDGKGLKLNLPGGELEGHPINLAIALDDFDHPVMQLEATCGDLDFEVMRFIRMPWSPKAPVEVFDLAIRGHIVANHALFGKLPLANVATDFDRLSGEWHVKDFTARTLGGQIRLDLAGRSGTDNRIHIKAHATGMDAGAISMLAGKGPPALTGRLTATTDIWANTDVDFFGSLMGTAAIEVQRGTVNRFALVTRVLSYIDLKNWLTARFPDPRLAGIPFDTITATLKGNAGDFNTQDLRLSGPVMEITARGDVRLGDDTLDMELSLIPFDTVNWLVRKIPIIGNNLSGGSKDLIAAYFHVYGPVSNPTVRPKPITSVAEFVAKTLSLPINIIKPNTINP